MPLPANRHTDMQYFAPLWIQSYNMELYGVRWNIILSIVVAMLSPLCALGLGLRDLDFVSVQRWRLGPAIENVHLAKSAKYQYSDSLFLPICSRSSPKTVKSPTPLGIRDPINAGVTRRRCVLCTERRLAIERHIMSTLHRDQITRQMSLQHLLTSLHTAAAAAAAAGARLRWRRPPWWWTTDSVSEIDSLVADHV